MQSHPLQRSPVLLFGVFQTDAGPVLPQEIGLDLAVSRVRHLGIDFLLQQRFGGHPPFPGLGFDEPLANEACERLAFGLIFLGAQWHQLRPKRLQQVLLRDRLPGDGGDRSAGADRRRALAEGGQRKRHAQREA